MTLIYVNSDGVINNIFFGKFTVLMINFDLPELKSI